MDRREEGQSQGAGVSEEIYFNKVTARTWQVTLADTHIFSPTIVNELRVGGTRPNSRRGPTIKDPIITDVLGLQNATGDSGWPCLYPYTSAVNVEFGSFYFDDDNPQTAPQTFITVADNLSWTTEESRLQDGWPVSDTTPSIQTKSGSRGAATNSPPTGPLWRRIPAAHGSPEPDRDWPASCWAIHSPVNCGQTRASSTTAKRTFPSISRMIGKSPQG